ncbi:type II secretion system F family protein [Agrococcus sp. DT81.2]|uniref:type II secretion system F family protein n=1 Tax=Agrococcus sp. DT81.2 TaxID=3393414 RepID=UPI003CE5265E
MTPMLVALCATVAGGLGLLGWLLASSIEPARARTIENLNRGERSAAPMVAAASRGKLERFARVATPPVLVALLERQHARAGRPKEWTVARLLTLKLVWLPTAAVLVALVALARPHPALLIMVVVLAIGTYFLPELLLLSRGQNRDEDIQTELADTLDQMTIAVEAGLGFDAALLRVASNGKGSLANELTRTMQDMQMGLSRRQAFQDLSERNNVEDLRIFIRAVLQADAFGISIGDVLRTQAGEMRLKRRQRAEEKAQQVPVKVLFPLMLCILPVLFIVIMAPAAMSLVETFSSVTM